MSTQGAVAAPPSELAPSRGAWDYYRLGLIVSWVLLAVAGYLTGARPTSFHRLEAAVSSGAVRSVTVLGEDPGRAWAGSREQEVRWRDGWVPRVSTVVVETAAPGGTVDEGGPRRPRITGDDAGRYLQAREPSLAVHRTPSAPHTRLLGWWVPDWAGWVALLLGFMTLYLVVNGPEPWRANRWAWFWLLAGPTAIGIPAFLLLCGPAPFVREPRRHPRGRLTGGWGLLLALALDHALGGD